jgi:hypothetical protein
VTLSSGFKGGEVTPLFFIGATLGNTLAWLFNAPVDLFAGLGFLAVFAGATNTPLACTVMGVELFGSGHTVYFATACFMAYYFSGHSGIYSSQRLVVPKRHSEQTPPDITLHEARKLNDASVSELKKLALWMKRAASSIRRGKSTAVPTVPITESEELAEKSPQEPKQ